MLLGIAVLVNLLGLVIKPQVALLQNKYVLLAGERLRM